MKKPRPTLDSLSSRFSQKDHGAPPPVPEPPAAVAAEAVPAQVAKPKDNRVQILTRIDPDTRRRLKVIAAGQDRTIQDICEEAIRDFVRRNSQS